MSKKKEKDEKNTAEGVRKEYDVVVIGDYGRGELASIEVKKKIKTQLRKWGIRIDNPEYLSVPAFNTIAAGFSLAQLSVTTDTPEGYVFFVNVAPRGDDARPRVNNEGEGFVYARLYNGVEVFAVNSGHTLSFIKEAAAEIREIKVKRDGSQFRSRDIFPPAMAKILAGDRSLLGEEIDRDTIPDKSTLLNRICHIDGFGDGDGFGNLKIFADPEEIEKLKGKEVQVTINDAENKPRTHKALVTERIFDVAPGEIAFAKTGSSGWQERPGKLKLTFAEVVVRDGCAYERFGKPKIGAEVKWKPAGP